jgi:hypothetical protein
MRRIRQMSWSEISKNADHASRGVLLVEHAHTLSDEDYWRAVSDAWQDSDRQRLSASEWRKLWTAVRPGRANVMDAEERDQLAHLPERVQVYRGVNAYNAVSGLSWTLDADTAHWFADIPGAGSLRVVIAVSVIFSSREDPIRSFARPMYIVGVSGTHFASSDPTGTVGSLPLKCPPTLRSRNCRAGGSNSTT